MKQMKPKGKMHSTRLTEKAYKKVQQFALLRNQSIILTLDQIIEDYLRFSNQSNA